MALTIAKWAGIILAGCIILLLVLCLALLFAPIRYQIFCDTKNPVPVKIRFRFLFPFFYAVIQVKEKKPQASARILGIKIFDLDKIQKKEENKKRKKKRKKKRPAKKTQFSKKTHPVKETYADKHIERKDGREKESEKITVPDDFSRHEPPDRMQQEKGPAKESAEKVPEWKEEDGGQAVKKKKQSIWDKIKGFFCKIKETFLKICDIIQKYMEKKDSKEEEGILAAIREKYAKARQMWEAEESKEFFAISKEQFQMLFRHIRPKSAKGTLVFGTGDPCMTGQLLGVLALFMPLYGNYMQIVPDFEQRRIQADFTAKGKLQLYKLLLFFKNWYLADETKAWKQKLSKATAGM